MPFTMEDFKKIENVDRLRVICMSEMDYYPLSSFRSLKPKEKVRFNEFLNDYIKKLPDAEVDWDKKIELEFNAICVREIFTEDFDPSKVSVLSGAYPEMEAKLDEEDAVRKEGYAAELKEVEDEMDLESHGGM